MTETEDQKRKRQALRLAEHAAVKLRTAERALHNAMRFAHEEGGASLRDIEAATGVSHMTVKRILARDPEPDVE